MLAQRSPAIPSRWQVSYPTVIGWTVALAILFPLDVRGAEDDEIPEPEEVTLKTNDDLLLHATFFPGTHLKESLPIILLHGFKGDRHDLDGLATFLQKQGHAVIVPDLRGHGDSTEFRRPPGERNGKIEAGNLRQADFAAMIDSDVEAVKGFLKEKNNEGELNIDKLCVVGVSEMGCLVAAGFSQHDWAWPPLATGKQGQDVKGLVLISPEANFKGLRMADAVNDAALRSQVAVLLIAGNRRNKSKQEFNNLYDGFKKYHEANKKDLVKFLPDSSLQGAKLISEASLKVNQKIAEFVAELVKLQYPWAERATPLN